VINLGFVGGKSSPYSNTPILSHRKYGDSPAVPVNNWVTLAEVLVKDCAMRKLCFADGGLQYPDTLQ